MEQKRCVVCDELYDANLRRCPSCFGDEPEPEPTQPPPAEKPAPAKPKREWKSQFDGAVLRPSPRALTIRAWTDRITLCIVAFCVSLELVAVLGFIVRVTIGPATVVLAALASAAAVVASLWRRPDRWRRSLAIVAICAVLLLGAFALSGRFYDTSYDGQAYQQSAVLRLAAGWNPIADVEGDSLASQHTIWHAHFAKGPWLEDAAMFRTSGSIEPVKGLNLFLACAAAVFCLGVFASLEIMPLALAGALAVLAAFNPIVIEQAFTFYVDGRASAWLTILVVALLDMALRADADRLVATIVGLVSAAALNIKFTATAFTLLLLLGGAIIIYRRVSKQQFWQAAAIIGAATIVALLLIGWNPYVTNTLNHGSPFYPRYGRGAFEMISPNVVPADFIEGGNLRNLYRAVFGVSDDPYAGRGSQMKLPFTIQPSEWDQFDVADQRVGALGPLFGGALLLSLLTAGIVLAVGGWRSSLVMIVLGIVGVALATVLINPEAWLVRYTPQAWLIPMLLAMTPFVAPRHLAARVAALFTCAVILANVAFVGAASVKAQLRDSSGVRAELVRLSAAKQPVPIYFQDMADSGAERFREAGISFRVLTKEPSDGGELYGTDTLAVVQ